MTLERRLTNVLKAAFVFFALAWPSTVAADSFTGAWGAAPQTADGSGYVALNIRARKDGAYDIVLTGPMKIPLASQPAQGALQGDTLSAEMPVVMSYIDGWLANPVTLSARAKEAGAGLAVILTDANGKTVDLDFLPASDPSFKQFQTPRIDAAGQAVREYQYTAPNAEATALPVSTLTAEGFDEGLMSDAVEAYLTGAAPDGGFLIVLRNGKLVMEEYFHGANRERLWMVASVSKSITSLAAGIAAAEGDLDLDKPINRYFRDYADTPFMQTSRKNGVTPRTLLRMGNIIGWGDSSNTQGGAYTDLEGRFVKAFLSGDWRSALFEYPVLSADPDPYYNYNTLLTHLLGATIEEASGKHLSTYVQEKILAPLGETRSSFDSNFFEATARNEDSPALAGSTLALRPLALAKIGQMMLDGGRWNGRQVVAKDWIAESTAVQAIQADSDSVGYGYKWWLMKFAVSGRTEPLWIVYGDGYGGQRLYLSPEHNLVVATGALNYAGAGVSPDEVLRRHILPAIIGAEAALEWSDVTGIDLGFAPFAKN